MAVTGVLLALMERHKSGLGQVVEVDMVGIYLHHTFVADLPILDTTGFWNTIRLVIPTGLPGSP